MNTPINDFLMRYSSSESYRCHMPGHKGMANPFDITEIKGADSLYDTKPFSGEGGIIAHSEEIATKIFKSNLTLYSCGGSTLSIQTMLGLVKAYGGGKRTIVAGRYSHKSLVSTAALLNLKIKWVYPDEYLSANISPEKIKEAIDNDTLAVFVNSIDYYGGMCSISDVKAVCGDIPLLVDNAHGAYLPFTEKGNLHPINQGADMCADSAHKTLPVLTGGSYLHIMNKKYIPRAKEIMSVFGSSSPSYLILQSLDLCNRWISENKSHISSLCVKIGQLKYRLQKENYVLKNSDFMRITINTAAYGYSGFDFSELLSEKKIECEMADENYVVLLFGGGTSHKELDEIYCILRDIPRCPPIEFIKYQQIVPLQGLSLSRALFSPLKTVKINAAKGLINGRIIAPCPPGVPLIMPGEIIDEECVYVLLQYGVKEIGIIEKNLKKSLL